MRSRERAHTRMHTHSCPPPPPTPPPPTHPLPPPLPHPHITPPHMVCLQPDGRVVGALGHKDDVAMLGLLRIHRRRALPLGQHKARRDLRARTESGRPMLLRATAVRGTKSAGQRIATVPLGLRTTAGCAMLHTPAALPLAFSTPGGQCSHKQHPWRPVQPHAAPLAVSAEQAWRCCSAGRGTAHGPRTWPGCCAARDQASRTAARRNSWPAPLRMPMNRKMSARPPGLLS